MTNVAGMFHSDDPESSKNAAKKFVESGTCAKHARLVYRLVKKHPGCTAGELLAAQVLYDKKRPRLEEYQIRRRLTDLHRAGCLTKGMQRPCMHKGTRMLTWHVDGPFLNYLKGVEHNVSAALMLSSVRECLMEIGKRLETGSATRKALSKVAKCVRLGDKPDVAEILSILDAEEP